MTDTESPPPETTPNPRFQFSLRTLLIIVAVAAVVLALLISFSLNIVVVFLLTLYPTVLLVFALFARGEPRAFTIGALVAAVRISVVEQPPVTGIGDLLAVLTSLLFWSLACGVTAIATHRWIKRHGWDQPS